MFSPVILSGAALLAMFQALPTTLAFSTSTTLNGITNGTMPELQAHMMNGRQIERIDCDNDGGDSEHKWKWAQHKYIWEGVDHLNGVSGRPKNGPGPGNCGRVSCSWRAAIYWCNDSKQEKELESYQEISWAVEKVTNQCQYKATAQTGTPANNMNNGGYVKGAIYMKDTWSVVVRYDNDHC